MVALHMVMPVISVVSRTVIVRTVCRRGEHKRKCKKNSAVHFYSP